MPTPVRSPAPDEEELEEQPDVRRIEHAGGVYAHEPSDPPAPRHQSLPSKA